MLMSETAPEIIDLEILPPGSKITVTIDTDLYIRLQQLMLEGLPFNDLDHLKQCLSDVRNKKADEGITYHLHTILYLLSIIESAAKEQKVIKTKKFDLTSGTPVDE